MSKYSITRRTTMVDIATAGLEIISPATVRARIMEIKIIMAAATASVFGIGRPAAIGVTPTTPVALLAEDPADPVTTVTTALAWATPPTVPAQFFDRTSLAAAVGTGIILTFPNGGLIIPASGSIVVWNITANGISDIRVVVET